MRKYSQLRGQIYYFELKQLLPSFGQLLAFLLSILYLAISASILTALISLSVIADINTSLEQRIIYQWGYFFLLYLLIHVQRKAILGLNHQLFLASLPTPVKIKNANTLLLTLVAGNLPLLAPLFLLTFIPNLTTFFNQLYFPLFVLSVLLLAWAAIKRNTLPWLSLLFAPVALLLVIQEYSLSAISLNSTWLLILVIELYFDSLSFDFNKFWRLKYYGQIRWIAIMQGPANALSRIFFAGLFIGMVAYVQYKMGQSANSYIQIVVCWFLAIIIGSYQFDNEAFYHHYPHYLSGLLSQFNTRYFFDILPAMFITLITSLVLYLWLDFSIVLIIFFPFGVLVTMLSVSKYHHNFFIVPSLIYSLLMFTYLSS